MNPQFRIAWRAIVKHYGRHPVLESSALTLASGECVVITGSNGAGKTTLLRILAGLERPDYAEIAIDGGPSRSWRRQRPRLLQSVMYLHQQPYMLAGSVRRNLAYAAQLNPNLTEPSAAVDRALAWAGLQPLENQSAASLSGGQKQRVALARARLREPRMLLLDEPSASLDRDSRERTQRMLAEFLDGGVAIAIVTHDPEDFTALATEQLRLEDRRLQSGPPPGAEIIELDTLRQGLTR